MVLDANILMRAVLGKGTRRILSKYGDHTDLVAPETAFAEARLRLPEVFVQRRLIAAPFMSYFDDLPNVVRPIGFETYAPFEAIARKRMALRDESDWPILATALALSFPIWTEDADFFGCGVATWTTDRVELYLDVLE